MVSVTVTRIDLDWSPTGNISPTKNVQVNLTDFEWQFTQKSDSWFLNDFVQSTNIVNLQVVVKASRYIVKMIITNRREKHVISYAPFSDRSLLVINPSSIIDNSYVIDYIIYRLTIYSAFL